MDRKSIEIDSLFRSIFNTKNLLNCMRYRFENDAFFWRPFEKKLKKSIGSKTCRLGSKMSQNSIKKHSVFVYNLQPDIDSTKCRFSDSIFHRYVVLFSMSSFLVNYFYYF